MTCDHLLFGGWLSPDTAGLQADVSSKDVEPNALRTELANVKAQLEVGHAHVNNSTSQFEQDCIHSDQFSLRVCHQAALVNTL